MKRSCRIVSALALIVAYLSLLSGCGSGGGAGTTSQTSLSQPSTYSISGTVMEGGTALPGVTVTLTAGGPGPQAVTNASGFYSFSGLPNGQYSVTPSAAGKSFTPTSYTVMINGADSPNNNFTAVPGYNVTGVVTVGTSTGPGLPGVTLTLTGASLAAPVTATSDANGNYSLGGIANGTYTVTAAAVGFVLAPSSIPVTVTSADAPGNSFIATPAYSVSGSVTLASPAGPLMDATVTVTGGPSLVTSVSSTTDAGGNYSVSGLVNGIYNVTPSNQSQFNAQSHLLTLYTFTPPNQVVTVTSANVPGIDFVSTATTTNAYTVSGSITGGVISVPSGTFILGGVRVVLSSPTSTTSVTTTTDANGNYAFAGVPNGAYTLSVVNFTTGHCPSPILYTFSPVSQSITVSGADLPVSTFAENVGREGCSIPI